MNTSPCRYLLFLLLSFATLFSARADLTRTQTISLHKGWNSVHVQVTPAVNDPTTVFANTPVTIAAAYLNSVAPVQFIADPSTPQLKKDGWAIWYGPDRADNFLSSLSTITGNTAYLIYATADYTWNITGTVNYVLTNWKPNSFNHVGFGVDSQSPPTFAKFFAGSPAHKTSKIFRLVNDQWVLLTDTVSTTMKSGEACWVYCTGSSDFQGPLYVRLSNGQQVTFGDDGQSGISVGNQSTDPLVVNVTTVTPNGPPLSYIVRGVSTASLTSANFDLPSVYKLPGLDPGDKTGFWLSLRREKMTVPSLSSLLKFTTDSGVEVWVPVVGTRNDLSATP